MAQIRVDPAVSAPEELAASVMAETIKCTTVAQDAGMKLARPREISPQSF